MDRLAHKPVVTTLERRSSLRRPQREHPAPHRGMQPPTVPLKGG
jgi:hypothetical protein